MFNSVLSFIPNKDNLGSGLLSQVVTFLLRLHFRGLLRPPEGGDSHMKVTGMLVGKLELTP